MFGGATTPNETTPAPAPASGDMASLMFGGQSIPSPVGQSPSEAPAQPQGDLSSLMFGHGGNALPGSGTLSDPNSDQPWYSRAWDALNNPLLDLKREGASGVEAGIEDFASSFTSPLNVGLTLASFGAAPLLESLGISLAGATAPKAIKAIQAISKVAEVGFTADMLKGIADQSPEFVKAIKNGDTDKALEIGTTMALSGGMAGLAIKHGVGELANKALGQEKASLGSTERDRVVGKYQWMLKEDTEQALNFNREFKASVPDVGTREALQFYSEAGGDPNQLWTWKSRMLTAPDDKVPVSLKKQVITALDRARNLSPDEIRQADKLRQWYDPDFDEAVQHDLLTTQSKKTNYVARARWADEPEETQLSKAKIATGDSSQPDHTKRRIYETTVDGILNGEQPVKAGKRYAFDAADVAADYHRAIGKEVAKKVFVDNALAAHGEDMRPLAVRGGSGHQIDPLDGSPVAQALRKQLGAPTGNPDIDKGSVIANSNAIPDRALTAEESKVLLQTGKLPDLVDSGAILDPNKVMSSYNASATGNSVNAKYGDLRWSADGYKNDIRSPHANGYAYVPVDNANPVLVKSPTAFHPELEKAARNILAPERSAIQDLPGVSALLKASSFAKHTLLGGSAFHWVQEGLRGIESGVNPFKLESWDLNNPRHAALVEAGGLQPGIDQGANTFTEGVKGSGLLSKIPGIAPVMDKLNANLFGASGFIDRLKLTTALKFADRLAKTNPELKGMDVYKVAGQMANARFGGLNYLAMGRSKEMQDIMRLTLLAPDWIESQVRDTAFAAMFPKIGVVDLARIAGLNFVAAQTLNLMATGKMHLDTPFSVQSEDGQKAYSVRTMPEDLWHLATDPRGFLANRLNPVITRTGMEAISGRDKMGRTRTMSEQLADLFQNIVPIPAQGLLDRATGNERPGSSLSDSAVSAAGLTTRPNYSPAEQLALQRGSERAGTGSVPAEALARHHEIIQLEERLRNGDPSTQADVQQALAEGEISTDDAKKILKDSRVSRLESITHNLPLSDALDIWDKSTDEERAKLAPILAKKMATYRSTEQHKQTPTERNRMNIRTAKMAGEMAGLMAGD